MLRRQPEAAKLCVPKGYAHQVTGLRNEETYSGGRPRCRAQVPVWRLRNPDLLPDCRGSTDRGRERASCGRCKFYLSKVCRPKRLWWTQSSPTKRIDRRKMKKTTCQSWRSRATSPSKLSSPKSRKTLNWSTTCWMASWRRTPRLSLMYWLATSTRLLKSYLRVAKTLFCNIFWSEEKQTCSMGLRSTWATCLSRSFWWTFSRLR